MISSNLQQINTIMRQIFNKKDLRWLTKLSEKTKLQLFYLKWITLC